MSPRAKGPLESENVLELDCNMDKLENEIRLSFLTL